jgi:hypothetical protein
MHHAGLLVGFVRAKQSVEACKAIGMHGAGITTEVIDRVLPECSPSAPLCGLCWSSVNFTVF